MQILAPTVSLLADPEQPINQVAFRNVALGAKFNAPSLSIGGDVDLAIAAGVNGALSIVLASDESLWPRRVCRRFTPPRMNAGWVRHWTPFLGADWRHVNGFGADLAASSRTRSYKLHSVQEHRAGFPGFKSALTSY